jgi:hypothetical protein
LIIVQNLELPYSVRLNDVKGTETDILRYGK